MTIKKVSFNLTVLGVVCILLALSGCSSKKHLQTIDEQKTQLDKANRTINELKKKIGDLDNSLKEVQETREGLLREKRELSDSISNLRSEIRKIEQEKTDLNATVVDGEKSADNASRRIKSLNSQIQALKKELEENEALLASKDTNISMLQNTQAELNDSLTQQRQQIATLGNDNNTLSQQMYESIASKNKTIKILIGILVLTVIVMGVGIIKGIKK